MFRKVLIANRGEIALRIIRACKELNIRTVAVYSKADANSLHVRFADEAICIGPPESANSYLNVPSIISAAEITDAEAIHPGYGFLAENAHFAEICESCGIKFIGPSAEVIRQMGNKVQARVRARQAGVSTLQGSGCLESPDEGREIAHEIGYPVVIKAAGGGGGRGMRVVHTNASFLNAFMAAQSETISAFGQPDIYLEKYLEEPKHVEVQILGDEHGNLVHLGERDCSVQRRYQKLIEEAPCATVSDKLRNQLGEAALKVAKKVGYSSAGTVEFLLEKNHFYFMEMNTRIQVEHPVTEMITRIDLVKEQIKIAAGKPLTYKQKDINLQGHSIECRICAEDPNSFIPCPGQITGYNVPGGFGVRVDTAIYPNYIIPPHYDSMVAKLITWGVDRQEAIAKMQRSLDEFVIQGINTTIPFHQRVFLQAEFLQGNFTTRFLEGLQNSAKNE